jgi:ribosomal protein L30
VWHRTRGPQHTAKELPLTEGMLQITQVRSGIGKDWRQKQTLEALGLRHQQTVVKQDSLSLRGMIKRVRALVEVTPVKE